MDTHRIKRAWLVLSAGLCTGLLLSGCALIPGRTHFQAEETVGSVPVQTISESAAVQKAEETVGSNTVQAISEPGIPLEYAGSIQQHGLPIPLSLRYFQNGDGIYSYELKIGDETFAASLRDDFRPESIDEAFEIWDMNEDGMDDIILDFGVFGHIKLGECYLSTESGYQPIQGFNELSIPEWSDTYKMVREEWHETTKGGVNYYRIQGTQLILEESLHYEYETTSQAIGPWYTIEKRSGDKMTVIQNRVKESEIDMDYWYSG